MPNPVPAKYTVQLGPTVTPEVAGELAAWAELARVSVSEMTRAQVERGLSVNRYALRDQYGEIPAEMLDRHTAAAMQRGERQVSRRRDYDDRTRTATAAAPKKRTRAKRSAA